MSVSVSLDDISETDAPIWMATHDAQIPVVGPRGLVLVRDVATWHRGSVHAGLQPRALPAFRYSTDICREVDSTSTRKVIRNRTFFKFHPHLRPFLTARVRPPSEPLELTITIAEDPADTSASDADVATTTANQS